MTRDVQRSNPTQTSKPKTQSSKQHPAQLQLLFSATFKSYTHRINSAMLAGVHQAHAIVCVYVVLPHLTATCPVIPSWHIHHGLVSPTRVLRAFCSCERGNAGGAAPAQPPLSTGECGEGGGWSHGRQDAVVKQALRLEVLVLLGKREVRCMCVRLRACVWVCQCVCIFLARAIDKQTTYSCSKTVHGTHIHVKAVPAQLGGMDIHPGMSIGSVVNGTPKLHMGAHLLSFTLTMEGGYSAPLASEQ